MALRASWSVQTSPFQMCRGEGCCSSSNKASLVTRHAVIAQVLVCDTTRTHLEKIWRDNIKYLNVKILSRFVLQARVMLRFSLFCLNILLASHWECYALDERVSGLDNDAGEQEDDWEECNQQPHHVLLGGSSQWIPTSRVLLTHITLHTDLRWAVVRLRLGG